MPVVTRPGTVVILDFGSQVSQLIARRTREANVYSELLPYDTPWAEIAKREPAAIILSGGPESTLAPDAPGLRAGSLHQRHPAARHLLRHAADREKTRRRRSFRSHTPSSDRRR